MSLFDDVIVNVAAAVDTVGRFTGDVVDRSRARVSSVELKNKINNRFETLGRYVYDTSVAGKCDQTVIDGYVEEITELIGQLKSLQDMLASDGGRLTCPKCCCKNSADSLFCKKCGSSLDFANSYTVKSEEKEKVEDDAVKAEEAPAEAEKPADEESAE